MKIKIILFNLLLIAICNKVVSQEPSNEVFLTVKGGVTHFFNGNPISEANVKLYEKGVVIESVTTKSEGLFNFNLKLNSEFYIEVSKNGMVTKKIYYNTALPEYEKSVLFSEFEITLYEPCPTMDYALYNEPVAMVRYNKKMREFNGDKDYEKRFLQSNENLIFEHENCAENEFKKLVKKADDSFKAKKYTEARAIYSQARELRSEDKYVQNQINEIDKILANQGANDKQYATLIQQADNTFKQNNLILAKELYKKAQTFKPTENYPASKIQEIDRLLAQKNQNQQQMQASEAQYQQHMNTGNNAMAAGKLTEAKQAFQQALVVKPADPTATQKLNETDRLINDKKKMSFQEIATRQLYDESIAEADSLLAKNDLTNARASFIKASAILPDQPYPKQKISEIDQRLKAMEQDKEKYYTATITEAEKLFAGKTYDQAKTLYQKALTLKPAEQYPRQKIAEIDKLLLEQQKLMSQQKARQALYDQTMAEADKLFAQGDLTNAKATYNKALTIFSDQVLPKQKIQEIDNILKIREQDKEKQFLQFIQLADKAFVAKELIQAKANYENAQKIKPADAYTNQRIAEVNRLIAEQQQSQAKLKATDDAYNAAIQKANNAFIAKQYKVALTAYQEAQLIKPNEQLPPNRIVEINNLLKLADVEKSFSDAVAQGDNYMKIKDYDNAQMAYQNALSYKPDEPYATKQKALAEKEIISRIKMAADQKARKDAYDKSIIEAEKMLAAKDYENARATFQSASNLMPNEVYPKQKIAELDVILGDKKKQNDYQAAVVNGDNLLSQTKINEAEVEYKKALLLKPNDTYATGKINEINQLRQKQLADNQNKAKKQQDYQQAIALADDLFNKANYEKAKAEYEKAQIIMFEEVYPKQKINKIKEILNVLAKDKVSQQQQQQQQQAKKDKKALEDLKFKDDSERESYLKGLLSKYPPGITLEVYKEEKRTIFRYIVVRDNMANDFREIRHSWGGVDYIRNDKPATSMFFSGQVKSRDGEYFNKIEF